MVISLLRRLLRIPEPVVVEHPVFGRMHWMKPGYWEAECEVDGERIGVTIDITDGEPGEPREPSEAQAAFFQRIMRDPEIAFRMGEPLLRARYESWVEEPFPPDWRTAFRFAGFSIPVNPSEQGTWDVTFDCLADPAGHVFTCWFENGVPVAVAVDG